MNIKHLEFFVAVAQYGSINKAAQSLYISQPHLSHIIKEIETDVGFDLFQRTKQGVVLTPEGEQFLEHSNAILREMENLKRFSRKVKPDKDRLSLSMTKFSHTMESFNEVCCHNENLESFSYRLNEGSTVDVIDDVLTGTADVGVIHFASHESAHMRSSLEQKGITVTPIASLSLHIVISKNHELIQRGQPVTLAALQDYGFVRYYGQYEDFIYNIATENVHLDLNNSPKITYVYGRAALLHLIASSNFYTIGIQGFTTQDSMYQVLSMPIPNCKERVEFGIITLKDCQLSDSEKEFVDNVTRRYRRLQLEDEE
ncbi:LysR family transcriptional regulator [Pygmaiobacter massiliensis]|uniref:LysR family transcriptional regulator n=1 Tax=Pygmaiobacter massiliensis TaxID=1917873 RepID=UPI002A835874|nr:LysR family transcriptional regulator [Pygmaiobacter massiliensis]MDY4783694.1 LysR family transcriptional regulator [Pygmaiobacter massiliensis]